MTPLERDLALNRHALLVVTLLTLLPALQAAWLGQWLIVITLGGVAALLLLKSRASNLQHENLLAAALCVFAAGAGLACLLVHPGTLSGLTALFLPALVFLVGPVRYATILSAVITLAFALIVWVVFSGPEKPLLFFGYFLYLLVLLGFVYLREVNESQLRPLRRTDNLTLAATREYLLQDLAREIQRNEREGTALSVMSLSLDRASISQVSREQLQQILLQMGQILRSRLRVFDNYYRFNESEIAVVLPCTPSADARDLAARLKRDMARRLKLQTRPLSIAVGLASLNVGDTAQTLVETARSALQHEQNLSSSVSSGAEGPESPPR